MSTNFERMQAVTLTLPGVPPNFTNQRKYDNPFAYMELRKNWKRTVYYSAGHRDRQWLMAMAKIGKRMRVDVTLQHFRLYDADSKYSCLKPLLDSMVELEFLAGDTEELLDLHVSQEKIRASTTVISIREANGER